MTRARRAVTIAAALLPALALALAEPRADDEADRAGERPGPALPVLTVPSTWQPQPTLVEAARAAGVVDLGRRPMTVAAWGDPILGCFATALAIELRSGDDPVTVLGHLRTALAAGATVDGWTEAGAVVTARLTRPGWQGELRAQVTSRTSARATAATCFYNDRAPTRCQAACTALLASLPSSANPSNSRKP